MRFSQLALLLVAILVTPAAAQQAANPVTQHYRAYRAALERGDLATADTEAAAALEVAQLDPHSTATVGALAMNVALVRLSEGHRDQALAPAQLAASLAGNPQAHVDPLAADIALKRASLRTGDQSEAELLHSLSVAQERGGFDEYVFDGAADLGAWATQQRHLPAALSAWQIASRASPGESDAAILSRAHALVEVGVSMFRIETEPPPTTGPTTSLPLSAGNGQPTFHPNIEIYNVLADAARILRPLAERRAPDGSLTQAQLLFARAIAFLYAEYSRLDALRIDTHALQRVPGDLKLPTHADALLCNTIPVALPLPAYPPAAQRDVNVGAVVARFVIDGNGQVTDERVIATVGGAAFERSVTAVIGRWRIGRAPTSPGNCDMAMTLFTPIVFGFAD